MKPLAPLLLLTLALAACGPRGAPEAPPPGTYRDLSVPIASTTRFDAGRMAGHWEMIARFGAPAPCPGGVDMTAEGAAMTVAACGTPARRYAVAGPGQLSALDGGEPLWVLWVDEGFRTAVIGTPSGSFGWLLNREAQIPADRRGAAGEILDFYGYDPARLAEVIR